MCAGNGFFDGFDNPTPSPTLNGKMCSTCHGKGWTEPTESTPSSTPVVHPEFVAPVEFSTPVVHPEFVAPVEFNTVTCFKCGGFGEFDPWGKPGKKGLNGRVCEACDGSKLLSAAAKICAVCNGHGAFDAFGKPAPTPGMNGKRCTACNGKCWTYE